jgi:hypothetical protein
MAAFAEMVRRFGLALAAGLAVSILATVAQAYTAEQQQACTSDALRICSSEIPDVDRITACMIRNKSQLSPGCLVFFRPEPEAAPATARRPLNLRPVISPKPVRAKPRKSVAPTRPAVT